MKTVLIIAIFNLIAWNGTLNESLVDSIPVTSNSEEVGNCAKFSRGDKCGFAKAGHEVYVVNNNSNRRVRVTVSHGKRYGGKWSYTQQVYTLPAGGETYVGCSSGGFGEYDYNISYSIKGCEIL